MVNKSKMDKLKEAAQAVRDLNRNYWDMKRDNTIGVMIIFIVKQIMRQHQEVV